MEKILNYFILPKKKTAGETRTRSLRVRITVLQPLTYSAVQHQIDCIYCILSAQSEIHGKLRNITSRFVGKYFDREIYSSVRG